MFSFHKPKIYRSNLGCCICKAKSSSSRFTDSKKYENEFENCFRLKEKRTGEICNACVLLVKRFKKLTPDNKLTKHWHHVVDARAGPGTKLTGNRRLTSPSSSHRSTASSSSSSSSAGSYHHHHNDSSSGENGKFNGHGRHSSATSGDSVLPLSSSQSGNHQSSSSSSSNHHGAHHPPPSKRLLSKVCAIDTNVSTFTFGEPIVNVNRTRSYMVNNESNIYSKSSSYSTSASSAATYSSYASFSSSSSSSSFKPQSALNSSAFESVIKRFRQRQQQQHLETQRRLMNRKLKAQQRAVNKLITVAATNTSNNNSDSTPAKTTQKDSRHNQQQQQQQSTSNDNIVSATDQIRAHPATIMEAKRSQRYSSSDNNNIYGINTVLDNSIWRKEKICCGVIFRGLYNEIAIVPRLLKPCQCRLSSSSLPSSSSMLAVHNNDQKSTINLNEEDNDDAIENDDEILLNEDGDADQESDDVVPPPRATKSGSISSCDSNTSGCGSLEETSNANANNLLDFSQPGYFVML